MLHPTVRAWLLEGPLSAQVPAYTASRRFRASGSLLEFLKKLKL